MEDNEVLKLFEPLFNEPHPENAFHVKKPLLAHYTTIQVLEKILTTNELWFSNPLFMNDLEELRFGVLEGNALVMQSEEVAWTMFFNGVTRHQKADGRSLPRQR